MVVFGGGGSFIFIWDSASRNLPQHPAAEDWEAGRRDESGFFFIISDCGIVTSVKRADANKKNAPPKKSARVVRGRKDKVITATKGHTMATLLINESENVGRRRAESLEPPAV